MVMNTCFIVYKQGAVRVASPWYKSLSPLPRGGGGREGYIFRANQYKLKLIFVILWL